MVLEAVVQSWTTQRETIEEAAGRIREQLGAIGRLQPAGGELSRGVVEAAASKLRMATDLEHGGIGGPPKFPPSSALELMLTVGEPQPVEVTLDAMAAGGMHDHIGGGFARYSVAGNRARRPPRTRVPSSSSSRRGSCRSISEPRRR
jgi:hypothetical protein